MPLGKGKAWFEEGTQVSFLQDGPLTGFPWTQCCLRWSHGEEEATFHAKLSLYQCSAFFNACTKGLVCCSPWSGKESDMTVWLNWTEEVMGLPGAMQETRVQFLGGEDPLEKEKAIHSSILAWEIPGMKEPGGLQYISSWRVGYQLTETEKSCWVYFSSTTIANLPICNLLYTNRSLLI